MPRVKLQKSLRSHTLPLLAGSLNDFLGAKLGPDRPVPVDQTLLVRRSKSGHKAGVTVQVALAGNTFTSFITIIRKAGFLRRG